MPYRHVSPWFHIETYDASRHDGAYTLCWDTHPEDNVIYLETRMCTRVRLAGDGTFLKEHGCTIRRPWKRASRSAHLVELEVCQKVLDPGRTPEGKD